MKNLQTVIFQSWYLRGGEEWQTGGSRIVLDLSDDELEFTTDTHEETFIIRDRPQCLD